MKNKNKLNERGQALVLIAIGAVVLFAFTALAIDGSAVFADRRHAQNAADTAALDAALARVRGDDWNSEGLERALSNGYTNDADSSVVVYLCTDPSATCQNLPTGADPSRFVQVKIESTVSLRFARIIGWSQITNRVDAIARATLPEVTDWFDGKALVSVMEGCPNDDNSPSNNDPFSTSGNSSTTVNLSGIFVNSSCNPAFDDNGNSNSVTSSQGVCVVGGVAPGATGISPPPDDHCGAQIDPDMYKLPNPSCGNQVGAITGSGGNYDAWPGNFNQTGNKTFPDASPSGTLKLHKGIYCLWNGISLQGNWNITTDVNGDGQHNPDEGVLFYIPDGDLIFNGGSTINVHAIDSLIDDFPEELLNYLVYIPPTNEADVTLTGNSGSVFTGTILAPASHVELSGSGPGNTLDIQGQVIGYDMKITGSGTINVTYNAAQNAVTTTQPGIQQTE